MNDPIIIIFEGPNYVGKTNIAKKMKPLIEQRYNKEVVIFREPGSCEASESMRDILFKHDDLEDYSKALLFTASRYEAFNKEVFPLLEQNKIVIMDRSALSTLVYQNCTNEILRMTMPLLKLPNYEGANKIMCVLDTDTEIIEERRKRRGITKSFDEVDTDELRAKYRKTVAALVTSEYPLWDDCAMIRVDNDYKKMNSLYLNIYLI